MALYFNREEDRGAIDGKGGSLAGARGLLSSIRGSITSKVYISGIFLALALSIVGFSLSLVAIKRIRTPAPIQILCNSADLERADRAGQRLQELVSKSP